MRSKCDFTFRGQPRTKPGTEDDEKRIALSRWITDLLVRHGDEKEGDYVTPGAETTAPLVEQAPRHDEWVVLVERLGNIRKQLWVANQKIQRLLRQ